MLRDLFAIQGQLPETEWPSIPGNPVPSSFSEHDKKSVDTPRIHSSFRARPFAWIETLATVLALMAVLFIVSRCFSWRSGETGPHLAGRGLAYSGERGDQHRGKRTKGEQTCEDFETKLTEVEDRPVDSAHTDAEVSEVEAAKGRDRPVKRNITSKYTHGPSKKAARPAEDGARVTDGLELSEELLDFYLDEALEADEVAAFEPWLLDPDAPFPSNLEGVPVEEQEDKGESESSLTGAPGGSDRITLQPSPPPLEALEALVAPQAQHPQAFSSRSNDAPANPPARSPSLPLRPIDYEKHPFFHLPDVPKSILQESSRMKPSIRTTLEVPLTEHMNSAREILAKPVLTARDVQTLLNDKEYILHYAFVHMARPIGSSKSSCLLFQLEIRLLVADTLWSMCEVVGPAMEKDRWWKHLMESMLVRPRTWKPKRTYDRVLIKRRILEEKIAQVLDTYKAGQRPAAETVVQLKRAILCDEDRLAPFSDSEWDPWRQADRAFLDAT